MGTKLLFDSDGICRASMEFVEPGECALRATRASGDNSATRALARTPSMPRRPLHLVGDRR
uniref:Uncharacterized protein n=1 Tax=Arundo donax TaxID=35708 RepID=A0A0A9BQ98_ARUDO